MDVCRPVSPRGDGLLRGSGEALQMQLWWRHRWEKASRLFLTTAEALQRGIYISRSTLWQLWGAEEETPFKKHVGFILWGAWTLFQLQILHFLMVFSEEELSLKGSWSSSPLFCNWSSAENSEIQSFQMMHVTSVWPHCCLRCVCVSAKGRCILEKMTQLSHLKDFDPESSWLLLIGRETTRVCG